MPRAAQSAAVAPRLELPVGAMKGSKGSSPRKNCNSPSGHAVLLGRGSGEGKVTFEHNLTRDNVGEVKDYYDMPWGSWLGKGAFGTVRRAICKRTGLERAIKSIMIPAVEAKHKLEAEIAVQERLHHPNIVRLFETFRSEKQLDLVMEFCSGGELFNKITQEAPNGFQEEDASGLCRQIVSAVCYLHSRRIAHRDLKPENFLLCGCSGSSQTLKLADFGNARFTPGGRMSTPVGTAYYVAPEVLEDAGYTELCDIWSIGIMVYVLLVGYPPYRGKTPACVLRKVKKTPVRYDGPGWAQISRVGKSFVQRLLQREVKTRPNATKVYQEPWLRPGDADKTPRIASDVVSRLLDLDEDAPSMLRQVAVTAVVQNLPEEKLEAWRLAFQALDTDGDGLLSLDEIRRGLIRNGLVLPDALEDTMRAMDSDGSGSVDYSEFLAATMDQRLCVEKDMCRAAFHCLDLDGDGAISPAELGRVLGGGDAEKTPSHNVLVRMVEEADLNGDGVVDFDEFCWLMRPKKNQQGQALTRSSGAWALGPRRSGSSIGTYRLLTSLGKAAEFFCSGACGPGATATAAAAAAAAISTRRGPGTPR
mmetsp:Transcript_48706/g.104909  ORF Transcript_48706/g.104909 Transcript_48706/m.104909 type:complete len:589 (+) Transcript_48706:42-1808(+)